MKIAEILTESKQLDEGPLANKIGTAIGKGVGVLGKGIGAAAGGVVGLGKAIKKGYQAGKDVVSLGGDDDPNAAPSAAKPATAPAGKPAPTAPAAQAAAPAAQAAPAEPATAPGGGVGAQPSAQAVNKAGPKGTAPAANLTGAAKAAADKVAAATQDQNATQAGQTLYAQMKANVDKLDKKGKQRLLALLQKSIAQAPTKTSAAAPATTPAAPTGNYDGKTGAPLSDKAKADAAFDASPEGQAQQAKVDAMGTAPAATTGKKPVKIRSRKKAPAAAPAAQPQVAGYVHNGKLIAEGLSLFRKN